MAYSAGWHLANPARIAAGDGKKRRSASGAAVRRTRGGESVGELGCACSSGAKTGYGFRTALGRAWGRALGWNLVRERVARFVESPACSPSGFAARGSGRQAEAVRKRCCFCGSSSRRACGGASSMPGPDAAARTQQNGATNEAVQLRLFEPRSLPPPHAADCYRLRASSAVPNGIAVLVLG